jgi:RNA polymerase sigma-70 factor, ECF subfamily
MFGVRGMTTVVEAAEEAVLLKEAQLGNHDAFGELYACYAPRIFRFLCAQLDNRMDAEDLTEEVFLKTWQALPNYRSTGVPFSAFLYRVAANTLVSHLRGSSRPNGHISLDDREWADTIPDLADHYSKKAEHSQLRQCLTQLKQEYQTVLVARFISELSTDETARLMGKSPGAVRVLQHRALSALRKIMVKNENSFKLF